MSLWSRVRNVFGGDRLNRDLDEEMRLHIEEAVAVGRDPAEARRAFGNALELRERSRDFKVVGWLDALVSDVRFGLRQIAKNRVTSGAAILSLALATGASTGAFRLIDAMLLRPLPVAEPNRLFYFVYPFTGDDGLQRDADSWAYPLYRELRDAVVSQADLMGISYASRIDVSYSGGQDMEKATRQYVSGNALGGLGIRPALGRLIVPADDLKPGAHPLAVISYSYWTSRFGRDPGVIGKRLHIGDDPFEIIGVTAEGFTGVETGSITDLFVPMAMNTRSIEEAGWNWFRIWMRPRPGHSAESVRDRLQAVFSAHRRERVKPWAATMPAERLKEYLDARLEVQTAAHGPSSAQREFGRALAVMGALVGLTLLIACANVANLLTAQGAARAREMALRMSIGAGRGRLLQLVLVESAIVAMSANVLGAAFAYWSAPWVAARVNPPDNPLQLVLPWDWRVLAFMVALTITVTLLFGIAPALRASGVKPMSALRGGEDPHSRRRLAHSLVAAQVAFCFLVHFAAGLFVATFQRISNQPLGFEPQGVLLLETGIKGSQKKSAEQWRQIAGIVASVPGVERAAVCSWALMSGNGWTSSIRLADGRLSQIEPYYLGVSPGFLTTMRIPLIAGRDFTERDVFEEPKPGKVAATAAIVNQSFARQFFPGENAVGRAFESPERQNSVLRYTVVGIIPDLRYRDLREPMRPMAFVPFAENEWATLAVRASSGLDNRTLAAALRHELSRIHPEFRVSNVSTQSELVRHWSLRERLMATLSTFFAGLSLLLAGIGLYGVLTFSVQQHTREIGLRMALGASPGRVVGGVLVQTLGMLFTGAAAGLAAGIASERFLKSLLYSVNATDLAMLATPLATLLITALVAALPPALSAIRVDPAQALRAD
jgi:putative ABC transport system permease protein